MGEGGDIWLHGKCLRELLPDPLPSYINGGRPFVPKPSTAAAAVVVNENGEVQERRRPAKAADVLSENPDCFLSNSDSMGVDSEIPQVRGDEDLEVGQLYFLLPVSRARSPLSLQDMCRLAPSASAALNGYFSPAAGAVSRRRGVWRSRASRPLVALFDWALTVRCDKILLVLRTGRDQIA
ncbi:unnamed protein product [Cuscuta campestris]|uniref:Uncharacterized protein n=1 Tax=Cuscuta campestris TaxID=132261 RepID=A0A484KYA1_9ASTE|nr:unnamed protein product [Cuscuta campestris]